jgi:valyl-tRNA synthetase
VTETLDKWVLSRLAQVVRVATENFAAYEYADAFEAVERFFWADLCDNYLELVKARAYGESGDAAGRLSAQITLWHCLETVLRLIAPVMPHLTEELYSLHFPTRHASLGSIHARGTWPRIADQAPDADAERVGQSGVQILTAIRKIKSERKVSIKTPIAVLGINAADHGSVAGVRTLIDDLRHTVAAAEIRWLDGAPDDAVATDDGAFGLVVAFEAA